ncbi:MAG: sugar-transfer associated ATP-grasp domain-containing protein [Gammaproteobacteria bacterium]|nr:sugar-transfer associated ATP-grasp domain-containing protein [Gammaproteobacteria bacterium]
MNSRLTNWMFKPHISLTIVFLLLITLHISTESDFGNNLLPESVHHFSLDMLFEPDGDVELATYLPFETSRQELLDETIIAKSLTIDEKNRSDGRFVQWSGDEESRKISYRTLVSLKHVQYSISRQLLIPEQYQDEIKTYLQPTEAIPVHHVEIEKVWSEIKPKLEDNLYQVIEAIYLYIYNDIENMQFKGMTDSLTALRLEAASCNGKSRLFLSLARLNNLPSRLVGGVILNNRKKKTSHQWVEIYIEGHWVPFDTINGHFASIPDNYLELYRGDFYLFKHTANINFDYFFNSSKESISPVLYRESISETSFIPNAAKSLQALGLSLKSSYIFMLMPFCALVIAFMRNIVGIKTFGTFMPMLIAAACVFTGLLQGLAGFIIVLFLAFSGHAILGRFHILKVPRLAAIITLISIASLIGISLIDAPLNIESGILALFPAVIISFTADRIHDMSNENDWPDLLKNAAGTILTLLLCYLVFNSILLQGLFSLYPELLLLVLAALLYIGSWTGIRVTEIIRFNKLLAIKGAFVLGLNKRNRELISRENKKALLKLATDKLQTKLSLERHFIPVPDTWGVCHSHREIDKFINVLDDSKNFVIKPNTGSRGNGIMIITQQKDGQYLTISGRQLSRDAIRKHVSEILSGSFSQNGSEDIAYIEPRIRQHPVLQKFSTGLSDIRLIIRKGKLLTAMLRVPTSKSGGKANLHQGAVGVSLDVETGKTGRASINGKMITHHPDTGHAFKDLEIPLWNDIKRISVKCFDAIPLAYMGVDICLDEKLGPLVLEVNGRPGLEIQNVQNKGLNPFIKEHEGYA